MALVEFFAWKENRSISHLKGVLTIEAGLFPIPKLPAYDEPFNAW
jgi:hypothetical protein